MEIGETPSYVNTTANSTDEIFATNETGGMELFSLLSLARVSAKFWEGNENKEIIAFNFSFYFFGDLSSFMIGELLQ